MGLGLQHHLDLPALHRYLSMSPTTGRIANILKKQATYWIWLPARIAFSVRLQIGESRFIQIFVIYVVSFIHLFKPIAQMADSVLLTFAKLIVSLDRRSY